MTDHADCPGPCNAAVRATGEGHPRPGEPVWCRPCHARIDRLLAELPDLAALRERQVTGFHEQARTPARGAATTPSPSDAADDIDELDDLLLGWEMAYLADFNRRNPDRPMRPSPPRRGGLATVTDTTEAWLGRHLADILASDMAVPFGEEIAERHRELVSKTRAGTGRHRKPVPCPWCGMRLLTWTEGEDYVVCNAPGCRCRLTRDEYQAILDDAAAAAREFEHAR